MSAPRLVLARWQDAKIWHKVGIYMIKYEDKWERMINNESEVYINSDE
jgi:hypothetical protein